MTILKPSCREFARFNGWFWGACVWLGAASANDILICASYMYYLNRTSKVMAGPFERSSQAVIKVASIVLATNGLSALCAIVSPNFTRVCDSKVGSEALTRDRLPSPARHHSLWSLSPRQLAHHRPTDPRQVTRPLAPDRPERAHPPRRPARRRSVHLSIVRCDKALSGFVAASRRRRSLLQRAAADDMVAG